MKNIVLTLIGIFTFTLLNAQPTGWVVNSPEYEHSMTMTTVVEHSGTSYGASNDYLAAFVGGTCRGVAEATWVEAYNQYMFFLTVFSNDYSGEEITFKYYDADNDNILTGFLTETFTEGNNLGTASEPYLVTDTEPVVTYQVTFSVDDGTNPLEGANVTVDNTNLTTDAEGIAFVDLPDGDYQYTVNADGYQDTTETLSVSGADVTKEISLKDSLYTVQFTITDGSVPVEDATISVNETNLTTDASGIATIALKKGSYDYTVTAGGFEDFSGTIVVENTTLSEEVTLAQKSYAVTFLVANNASAIEGATINVNNEELVTDKNGEAYIELYNGEYEYTVTKENYGLYIDTLAVSGSPLSEAVELSNATYTLTFEVVCDTGALSGAVVSINDTTLMTDSDGLATVELLDGTYDYTVTKEEYGMHFDTVKIDGAPVNQSITLNSELYNLSFTVTSDTGLIYGAEVNVDDTILTTDVHGEATLELLNGIYEYTISKEDYGNIINTVEIFNADVSETITISKDPLQITFNVTSDTGSIHGAEISIKDTTIVTDVSGQATVSFLSGIYDYTIVAEGYEDFQGSVHVTESAVTEEVLLSPVPYPVNFTVYYNSEPVEDASILINNRKLVTDSLGKASIELVNGSYDYTVKADGLLDTTNVITVKDAAVEENVTLSSLLFEVTFSVYHESQSVSGAEIEINGETLTTSDEGLATAELGVGSHEYTVTTDSLETATGTVEVQNSPVYKNVFLYKLRYNVTFVVNHDDAPVEGANVEINGEVLTTDADGQAGIELENGDYQFSVDMQGFNKEEGTITVSDSDVIKNVFLSYLTHKVTFSVFDGTEPIEGASITVEDAETTTDSEGKAQLELRNGEYDYTCSADGYETVNDKLSITGKEVIEVISMNYVTGISRVTNEEVRVYPNPSAERINIQADNITFVELYNQQGQLILSKEGNISSLNVNKYETGIYILNVQTINKLHTVRLLIQ